MRRDRAATPPAICATIYAAPSPNRSPRSSMSAKLTAGLNALPISPECQNQRRQRRARRNRIRQQRDRHVSAASRSAIIPEPTTAAPESPCREIRRRSPR